MIKGYCMQVGGVGGQGDKRVLYAGWGSGGEGRVTKGYCMQVGGVGGQGDKRVVYAGWGSGRAG